MYHQPQLPQQATQLPIQVQPVQRQPPQQPQPAPEPQAPVRIVSNKLSNIQLTLIATVLFFVFANPKIFSVVNKILPGFIMDYAGKVTQEGTITHAVVFGGLFFLVIYLLQRPTVEGYTENYKKKYGQHGGMVHHA